MNGFRTPTSSHGLRSHPCAAPACSLASENEPTITCSLCSTSYHLTCGGLTRALFETLVQDNLSWQCLPCIEQITSRKRGSQTPRSPLKSAQDGKKQEAATLTANASCDHDGSVQEHNAHAQPNGTGGSARVTRSGKNKSSIATYKAKKSYMTKKSKVAKGDMKRNSLSPHKEVPQQMRQDRSPLTEDREETVSLTRDHQQTPNQQQRKHSLEEGQLSNLQSDIKRMLAKQDKILETQESLTKSLENVYGKLDEMEQKIAEQHKQMEELQALKPELDQLRREVYELQVERDDAQQRTYLDCVEVKGVTETADSLRDIVVKIGAANACEITREDIREINRRKIGTSTSTSVFVRFNNKQTRDKFLKSARSRRNMKAADVGAGKATDTLHVNEWLIPRRRMLLSRAKTYARENDIAYIWSRNGRILARKSASDTKFQVINHESDINRLFRQ